MKTMVEHILPWGTMLIVVAMLASCTPAGCAPDSAPGFVYDPSTPGHQVEPAGVTNYVWCSR